MSDGQAILRELKARYNTALREASFWKGHDYLLHKRLSKQANFYKRIIDFMKKDSNEH